MPRADLPSRLVPAAACSPKSHKQGFARWITPTGQEKAGAELLLSCRERVRGTSKAPTLDDTRGG